MTKPSKVGKNPTPTESKVYFMVTATVIYKTDDTDEAPVKQRSLNILMEHDTMNLTKRELDDANRAIIARVNKENNVQPNCILDVVFTCISILGMMPPDVFYAKNEAASVN